MERENKVAVEKEKDVKKVEMKKDFFIDVGEREESTEMTKG